MTQSIEQVRVRMTPDGRLDRQNAAAFLGRSPKTLAEWQRLGFGPPSFKVGGRRFYRMDDLKPYASGETPVRPVAA